MQELAEDIQVKYIICTRTKPRFRLTDKGCIIWLYMTTTLLIMLLPMLKEKNFNSIPLLSVSKPGWLSCIKLNFTIP
jgi:hypothetical protein